MVPKSLRWQVLVRARYSPMFFGRCRLEIYIGSKLPSLGSLPALISLHRDASRAFATPPQLSWTAMPPYFATSLQDSFPMVTSSPYRFPHPSESLPMPRASSFTSPTSTQHLDHLPSALGSIFSHTCYARFSNRVLNHFSSGLGPPPSLLFL